MAYYSFFDENNVIVEVITGVEENELINGLSPEIWYSKFRGVSCKRTSYNTRGGVHYDPDTNEPSADQSKAFRKNYAGIGYTYDEARDAFIPPQPFPSWTLNESTCLWEAPVPYPDDNQMYLWNEETQQWDVVDN